MLNLVFSTAARLLGKKSTRSSRTHFYYNKIYFRRISILYNRYREKEANNEVALASQPIQPLGLKFGTDYKTVTRSFDKTNFIYNNNKKEDNHKVVFVRQTIAELRMLVQLQFYNDELFFISLDLSRNAKTDEEKAAIVNTIFQKYLNRQFANLNDFPAIKDAAGNFMIINDDVHFSVCYFSNKLHEVHEYVEKTVASASFPKEKESLFYAF